VPPNQALHRMQPKVEDEDLILVCYQSRDLREGMDAFLSKRPPQWTGDHRKQLQEEVS
jgi:enoyl-CoA hydratase